MGDVVRGIGSAIGQIGRGVGDVAGGIFGGIGSVFGGLFEGIGSVAKGVLGSPMLMGLGMGVAGFTVGGPFGALAGFGIGGMLGSGFNQAFNGPSQDMGQMQMGMSMMPQMGMPMTGMMGAMPGYGMQMGMGMGMMPGGCYPGMGGMMGGYGFNGADMMMQQQMMMMMAMMQMMMMQQQMSGMNMNMNQMGFPMNTFPMTGAGRNFMGVPGGLSGMGYPQLPNAGTINGAVQPYSGTTSKPLDHYKVTSEFGPRWGTTHKGIDLAAPTGTPIKSAADGVITKMSNDPDGYGNWVEVKHPDGTTTRYAHMSQFGNVKVGQHVGAGSVIGAVGSTGHSTGPHLHFEVRDPNGNAVNPRSKFNI
ncbi:MAG: peptidoglycan DD-metalloendopeptidase family protein [Firmicutes bacterium]|nr:peptidoglycan DD-metalloendopeptidase family protein [Bacillota bacterium]